MGLCSGAYVAFQSAAQIVNPAFVESVLINPLTYYWKTGMTIDDNPAQKKMAVQYYVTSASQPSKWLKLFSGKTKIGFLGALKVLATKFGLVGRQQEAGENVKNACLGHPAKDDLPGDLQRIEQASRQLAFFFARTDPGYGMLMSAAGQKVKQLCNAGKASIHFIEDTDHTFSRQAARQSFIDAVCAYLDRQYHGK